MDLEQILTEYDSLFGEKTTEEITAFLEEHAENALKENDIETGISLLTELVGYCRDTSQKEKGLKTADLVLSIVRELGLDHGPSYGTILLNIANADRAYGRFPESEAGYQKAEEIFRSSLSPDDYLFASLYNNYGLLAEELSDFKRAEELFLKSLPIIRLYPENRFNLATTLTNLAMAEMHQVPPKMQEALEHLKEAEAIHETAQGTEFHYSATLSALGDYAFLNRNYTEAAAFYSRSLEHLKKNVGETDAVARIRENYLESLRMSETAPGKQSEYSSENGNENISEIRNENINENEAAHIPLERRAAAFCRDQVLPMLKSIFPDLLPYLAVGFSGEGSEHFGFDDEISTDHDYEPGVCIWVPENSPAAASKEQLDQAYRSLYQKTFGKTPDPLARHGVYLLDEYFCELTGIENMTDRILSGTGNISGKDLQAPEWFHPTDREIVGIAAAINGEIYFDEAKILTRIRTFFREQMPEDWRRKMLGTLFHEYCQYAQCNYSRSMKRGDYVTAGICKAMAVDTAAKIVYYLNRRYPPYYKWRMRGLKELPILPEIADICRAVFDFADGREEFKEGGTDKTEMTFDIISALLLNETAVQGLIARFDRDRVFADDYITQIAGLTGPEIPTKTSYTEENKVISKRTDDSETTAADTGKKEQIERRELIEKIVKAEWAMFDQVQNEGGRADCQNNWNTFSLMRESQYRTWPEDLLLSYYNDLIKGEADGRNLITEKYGRMMESTAPERFAEIKDQLPVLDEKRIAISEEIIRIQVGWMEDFASEFPLMAANARTIHTSDDKPYDTSYETYLRGELSTYSRETLALYGRFIISLASEGKNLAYEIMNQTALLYGYQSVEDAEEQMKKANW